MRRNSEGKLVDNNGNLVFKNDAFNQLTSRDHLTQVAPSSLYVDTQYNQVYSQNPDDTRVFIDYNVSKLVDDNASLASDENTKNQYINDIICLLGLENKILNSTDDNLKNTILGGLFATKEDESEDSKVPLYLINELLKAKCLNYMDKPLEKLDTFDVTQSSQVKDSTLSQQFDSVITRLKTLEYSNKDYFSDMTDDSSKYLAYCQVDPSGSVDVYLKCEDTQCMLYVTQGNLENKIPAFIVQKNLSMKQNATGSQQIIEQPQQTSIAITPSQPINVNNTVVPSVNLQQTTDESTNTNTNKNGTENVQINYSNESLINKMGPRIKVANQNYAEKKKKASETYNVLTELREKLLQAEKDYENAFKEAQVAADELSAMFNEVMDNNKEQSKYASAFK